LDKSDPLISPHGRRRDFFGRREKSLYKEAFSYLPQATVSDHVKFIIGPLEEAIPEGRVIIEKHDSLLAEVKLGYEEPFAIKFKELMEQAIDFRQCSLSRDYQLIIPAEIKKGMNWKDMEEMKLA
jgi:hypothetical protein